MAGFRTALFQDVSSSATKRCTGGSCFIQIPTDYNQFGKWDDKHAVFPEFFISICTKNGGYFDGGILRRDGYWAAFVNGGLNGDNSWIEERLPDITGQNVEVKFKGKKFGNEKYLCLYVNGNLVIKLNRYLPKEKPLGTIAEAAADGNVYKVTHELNLVPKSSTHYVSNSIGYGRAYFRNAKISEAIPVDESGFALPYSHSKVVNCDSNTYPPYVVNECCTVTGFHSKGFTSSIDFNNTAAV